VSAPVPVFTIVVAMIARMLTVSDSEPVSIVGCGFLVFSLPPATQRTFLIWTIAGLVIYLLYGYRKSPLAKRG
jgi:hypothetical protein